MEMRWRARLSLCFVHVHVSCSWKVYYLLVMGLMGSGFEDLELWNG